MSPCCTAWISSPERSFPQQMYQHTLMVAGEQVGGVKKKLGSRRLVWGQGQRQRSGRSSLCSAGLSARMAKPGAQRGGRSGGSAWSTRQLLKERGGCSRASGTHFPLRPNVVLPARMRTFDVLLTNAHGAREEYPEKNGSCERTASGEWLASLYVGGRSI